MSAAPRGAESGSGIEQPPCPPFRPNCVFLARWLRILFVDSATGRDAQ